MVLGRMTAGETDLQDSVKVRTKRLSCARGVQRILLYASVKLAAAV